MSLACHLKQLAKCTDIQRNNIHLNDVVMHIFGCAESPAGLIEVIIIATSPSALFIVTYGILGCILLIKK